MAITGGTPFQSPDGDPMRVFEEDGTLTNNCDEVLVCKKVLLIGGGGSGGTTDTRGGGGAGGVTIAEDVVINPGEAIPVTVGTGGVGNDARGEKSTLWVSGGNALDPDVDSAPSATSAGGGGYGAITDGGPGQAPNGSGGGGGRGTGGGTPQTSGGGSGHGTGNDGGGGGSNGCVSSCCQRAGGGGGSSFEVGGDGTASLQNDDPGDGGSEQTIDAFGLIAGGGGQGGDSQDEDSGSCTGGTQGVAGAPGSGYGAGGGGAGISDTGTGEAGTNGSDGVVAVIYEGIQGTPFHETGERSDPEILSMNITFDGSGVPTVTWTHNEAAGGVTIFGATNATGDSDSTDLTEIDSVEAADGSYELTTLTTTSGEYVIVELRPSASFDGGDLSEDSSGLIERDQFTAADQTVDGYNSWEESDAGSFDIVSNQVEARWATAENRRMARSLGDQGTVILQVNSKRNAGSPTVDIWVNAVSPTDLGSSYRLRPQPTGSTRLIKTGVGDLDTGTASGGTSPRSYRLVVDVDVSPVEVRGYISAALGTLQDLDEDPALFVSGTDAGTRPTGSYYGVLYGDPSDGGDADLDEWFLCGRNIAVTGVPTGWQIQVDARSVVSESGGEVDIDVDAWALPATTIKLLDGSGAEQDSLTPASGIWGGHSFTVSGGGASGTEGARYRASLQR